MNLRRGVFGLWLCGALACGGARQPSPSMPAREYPGYLAPSGTLGRPFVVQQSLRGTYGEHDLSLDVVVQLANGKLTLVGLTPFGSRAFVLEQVGEQTHFEKFVDREIPFDPKYVLNDVHRVFFRGLPSPQPDGVHSEEQHGEKVTETWRGGLLVERRFERLDGEPKGAVIARFSGAAAPVIAPEVKLENQWFGYSIDIESSDQSFLE
ncbi:MAG: DUF3261 domain-containing protein [Myxococcales bacterium]